MPFGLLLGLVVGGIAAIALLLHMLGLSRPLTLTEDAARTAWAQHYPKDDIRALTLAQNGGAALIDTEHGRALLWSFGADTVARYLPAAETAVRSGALIVRFKDYTAPTVRLSLTEAECQSWRRRIETA